MGLSFPFEFNEASLIEQQLSLFKTKAEALNHLQSHYWKSVAAEWLGHGHRFRVDSELCPEAGTDAVQDDAVGVCCSYRKWTLATRVAK